MTQATDELSQSLLLQLFEDSPQAIAIFDRAMCYIGYNASWISNYALDGQNIIGKNHYEVFPEIPQRWKDLHKRCLAGEILIHDADSFPRLHGGVDYITWQIRPWHDDSGNIGGIVMYTENITERIETQSALSKSQTRYKTLVENNPDYITELDPELRVKYINNVEPDTMASLIGRDYFTILEENTPNVNLELFRQCFEEVKDTHEIRLFVSEGILRNGEIGWYTTRIIPLIQKDVLIGFTVISTDITEHKRAENERERLIADLQVAHTLAKETSRLKSEFLATMSHELRTPMNAIEGFTSLMLNDMGGATYNEKTERYLGKISANSKRLLGLINDFLDLSRIESGRMDLIHHAINLNDLVRSWYENIVILAQDKGLGFTLEVDPQLPEVIYGDDENISKIAINLLSNAIKFTESGSVNLRVVALDDMWVIQVQDTGIGIPQHAYEFIFDEFRQVDQTSKRKFGGTGLGLAIVQKLTRLMHGKVTFTSVVNEGTTFVVQLPLHINNLETNP